jgi:phosphate uptake regulator
MYEAPDETTITAIRLRELMHKTYGLLQFALESLFNEDLNQSLTALPMDDEIDNLHRESIQLLIRFIQEKPQGANDFVQLILLVKGFEKIADHAIHIAQESIFSLDGSICRHLSNKKLEKLGDMRY